MDEKAQLRGRMRSRRRALSPEAVAEASRQVCASLLALPELSGRSMIALYAGVRGEIDPILLASALPGVCLPTVDGDQRILRFRRFDGGELSPGAFRIPEPRTGEAIPLEAIELFLVPGLAFDRDGGRLGTGGGYYDHTLAHRAPDALCIGLCHDFQLVEQIPAEEHDHPMDLVVTDASVLRPPRRTRRTAHHDR